jgi:hypothetical protein
MSNEIKHGNAPGHGDYERRDIGVGGVLYFLAGLAAALFIVYFIVNGIFHYLDKRVQTEQPPISPLVKSEPRDTRRLAPGYKDSEYDRYLKDQFPAPQLEVNERTELNDIRLREEDTLSTYGWVDKDAGKVHIPIDRAMDLLVERGLPVRESGTAMATTQQPKAQPQTKKESQQ